MFGFLREIDFVVCLGLVDEKDGKDFLYILECELFVLYDVFIGK